MRNTVSWMCAVMKAVKILCKALVTLLPRKWGSSRVQGGHKHDAESREQHLKALSLNQLVREKTERLLWTAACMLKKRLKSGEFSLFFLTKHTAAVFVGTETKYWYCTSSGLD